MRQTGGLSLLARCIAITATTAATMFAILFITIWLIGSPGGYLLGQFVLAPLLSVFAGVVIAQQLRTTWLATIPGVVVGFVAFWAVMLAIYVQTAD